MFPVAVARSSSDICAISYVLPVLWMTSRLPYWAIWRVSDTAYTQNTQQATLDSIQSEGKMCVIFTLFLKMFSKKHAEVENSNDKYFSKNSNEIVLFSFVSRLI